MKKLTIYIILLGITASCGSGLYELKEIKPGKGEKVELKSFNLDDFEVFTYDMCECIKSEVDNDRFANCDLNFHNLPKTDSIVKVEETYLLKHVKSNFVIYLTTFSHKYLRLKDGFLNNSSVYKDKIVLDEIEYAYIGNHNKNDNWIHFPNKDNGEDIILHYNRAKYPASFLIEEANIATAENDYATDTKIPLTTVFKQPVEFIRKDYVPIFYEGKIGSKNSFLPKCINVLSRNGDVEIIFGCIPSDTNYFKISNKKIRYSTNFYLLPGQQKKL